MQCINVVVYNVPNKETMEYINTFVEVYNLNVTELGGESLNIAAFLVKNLSSPIQKGTEGELYFNVDMTAEFYKKSMISAVIIPSFLYAGHDDIITKLIMAGIDINDVYIMKRIAEGCTTGREIVDDIEPYLSAGYLPYLEYHIADNCNLNCVACEHYSGLCQENHFPNYDRFEKQFRHMKQFVNDVGVIRILGGEPLLNPELEKYMLLTRELFPHSVIYVVTNGILVDKLSYSIFEVMKKLNIRFHISFYPPLVKHMEQIRTILDENSIEYTISYLNTKFTKKQTLDKQADYSYFFRCYQAHCHNFYDGKMAACFLPFVTKYFNRYFDKDLPEDGAIDLFAENMTREKLFTWLLVPFERCRYCTDPIEVEWDTIKKPSTLSDWIIDSK